MAGNKRHGSFRSGRRSMCRTFSMQAITLCCIRRNLSFV